mmetsp:Transcript_66006/g.148954  ORF Transcript_66006/g.148954 Transcript_66006/m.148954 type:complete len:212 (+) Transcript_66006:426-1061(+)
MVCADGVSPEAFGLRDRPRGAAAAVGRRAQDVRHGGPLRALGIRNGGGGEDEVPDRGRGRGVRVSALRAPGAGRAAARLKLARQPPVPLVPGRLAQGGHARRRDLPFRGRLRVRRGLEQGAPARKGRDQVQGRHHVRRAVGGGLLPRLRGDHVLKRNHLQGHVGQGNASREGDNALGAQRADVHGNVLRRSSARARDPKQPQDRGGLRGGV